MLILQAEMAGASYLLEFCKKIFFAVLILLVIIIVFKSIGKIVSKYSKK